VAAAQGHASAQCNFGIRYANGEGVPQDHAEAVRWYRLAADQGDARALNNLGAMYGTGAGVPQDYVQAHMWANLAARFQLAPGTDQLGTVRAISVETGQTTWVHEQRSATMSLVTTGGGLVFGGDVNGRFRAFDQETGEVLWEINLGSSVTGFPISFAVDGRQYVAVSTGSAATASGFIRLTPEIRPSAGNNLFVFALPVRD
jgi:outer membrane protein assembly factor BamB